MASEFPEFAFETYVITLDPKSDRFLQFAVNNPHLPYKTFQGIRGSSLSLADCVYEKLMTPECLAAGIATAGEIGCAASHKKLWELAANSKNGMLILEDDAATHPLICEYIRRHQEKIFEADIFLFSINTDSILEVEAPNGLRQVLVFEQKYPSYAWIASALQRTKVEETQIWRLIKGFGLCCYFLTPKGAKRILELVFPLTLERTALPLLNISVPGINVDKRLIAFYENIDARISMPFLAWSPNSDSTTR
jgi:glycosyl transferase, family 25